LRVLRFFLPFPCALEFNTTTASRSVSVKLDQILVAIKEPQKRFRICALCMAIVVTSMAAASCGQVVVSRACLRNRDPNDLLFAADEVPNSSKRLCVAADRELESPSVVSVYEKSAAAADHGVQAITLQRRPVTSPQQSSVAAAAAEGNHEEWKMNKGWEALELCLLERITRSLSLADLCRLSQVRICFWSSLLH